MATVRLVNVTKRFGDVVAVDNVTLEVREGELLVLLGPSGGGKTTTLRLIAGLEWADAGEIHIGDRLVNRVQPADRDTAYVFQHYALYPNLNARDNIAFPLRAQRVPSAEIRDRVDRIMKILDIEDIQLRKPRSLTSAQAQRVALGRAMVRNPQVFLMDEPLTNLDARLRARMRLELKHLQVSMGTTMIYVTHDQLEAMSIGDRIAIIHLGELQQMGPPMEVYNHPENLFIANFVGSPGMNFHDCIVDDSHLKLSAGDFRVPITENLRNKIGDQAAGCDLVLGVRPEDVTIHTQQKAEAWPTEVYAVQFLGSDNFVGLTIGEAIWMAGVPKATGFRIGDRVWAGLNLERLHIFDKKTGKAIR